MESRVCSLGVKWVQIQISQVPTIWKYLKLDFGHRPQTLHDTSKLWSGGQPQLMQRFLKIIYLGGCPKLFSPDFKWSINISKPYTIHTHIYIYTYNISNIYIHNICTSPLLMYLFCSILPHRVMGTKWHWLNSSGWRRLVGHTWSTLESQVRDPLWFPMAPISDP